MGGASSVHQVAFLWTVQALLQVPILLPILHHSEVQSYANDDCFAPSLSLLAGCIYTRSLSHQGIGWPTATQILLNRVEPQHLGYYWGLVSLSGNVGASVAPIAMALICEYSEEGAEGSGWQAIFVVGGGVAVLISVGVNLLLQSTDDAPPATDTQAQVKDTQLPQGAAKDADRPSPVAGAQASVGALAVPTPHSIAVNFQMIIIIVPFSEPLRIPVRLKILQILQF